METENRMVRAILIDPFTETVSEVQHDADDYRAIYSAISHESMEVDLFTVVQITAKDAVFVDDEGLLKDCEHFFMVWFACEKLAREMHQDD